MGSVSMTDQITLRLSGFFLLFLRPLLIICTAKYLQSNSLKKGDRIRNFCMTFTLVYIQFTLVNNQFTIVSFEIRLVSVDGIINNF